MMPAADITKTANIAKTSTPKIWEPIVAILVAATALALAGCANSTKAESASIAETKAECVATAVPNSYVIHWKDGTVSIARGYTRSDFEREVFEPNKKDIRLAEQDQSIKLSPMSLSPSVTVSAAPAIDDQWGQTIIAAPEIWNRGIKGAGIIVAVIDSGVDISHAQIKNQLATNAKEIPNNGLDDDENGFIDDVHGWDFEGDQALVTDDAGHGTHVAGVIVAQHGSSTVRGIAPEAKLLPLDFMNAEGQGNIGDAILAIQYAADQGARVINASWGGSPCSQTLKKTISDLEQRGVMFVAAAGNSGSDLEQQAEYPAAFQSPNQLTVGASTARDFIAGFSNFSFSLVQLFAPGASITSTYPGNRTAALSGTSMAAPFVTGAVALLMSARPTATVPEIRAALLNSVDKGPFAASSQGRLNIKNALDSMK